MIQKENILKEAIYKAVRSGGSGGQHVNKVATCVQLFFDIHQSEVLDENQKNKLNKSLRNRINSEGILMLECSESRSQAQNKKMVGDKFFNLLIESFKEKKRRIKRKCFLSPCLPLGRCNELLATYRMEVLNYSKLCLL